MLCHEGDASLSATASTTQRIRAMPHATTPDGVKLYYEEAGTSTPILFVHEYCGDWRAGSRRCASSRAAIAASPTPSAAIPASDVPDEAGDAIRPAPCGRRLPHMLDHLEIPKAHVVGLSQGGFATAISGALSRSRSVAHPGRRRFRRRPRRSRAVQEDASTTAGSIRKDGMAEYRRGPAPIRPARASR